MTVAGLSADYAETTDQETSVLIAGSVLLYLVEPGRR